MEFKKFSAGPISYGIKTPNIDLKELKNKFGITNVNF